MIISASPIVAVYAYDGISMFHLSAPCLIFGGNRAIAGIPSHEVRTCGESRDLITTGTALSLMPSHDLSGFDDADILVVPGWPNSLPPPSPGLLNALRAGQARGTLIVGLCLGSFALAEAGLLDGQDATTHWGYSDAFRDRFPRIRLRPDVLYVDAGQIVTSAGVAASLDCCLHIIRRLYGAEAAARLARRLVLPPHRQGGQAQFIDRPVLKSTEPDGFTRAMETVRRQLHLTHDLDTVAASAGLTRRTFTRRCQSRFGVSFGDWLVQERLRLAQRLLETTTASIDAIAHDSGFGTAASLRQHFARHVKTSPAAYRRTFSETVR